MIEVFAAHREFVAYGPSHLVVLTVFAVGAALLVWRGRRQTEEQARRMSRVFALLILAAFATALFYKLIRPDLSTSIPLQLCDIAELTAAYALWSGRHRAFVLTYFWGLLLSSQALLTPDIGTPQEGAPDFPSHLFLTFFVLHVSVVWSAIYLTWGRGRRPGWHDWRFAVVVTLGWVAFTLTFNAIAGTNYGYLNAKPPTASVLDLLGPWPAYLLIEIAVVILAWALMTWPWARTPRSRQESTKASTAR
ncbi:TIGR02206 family membrane protein [Mycolicibacterium sp. F2034L]|uniref:YwaF family protein n=1 Tax=Mycolicibacterium sp. F2034L TaxID=2926422 RepID=UPI0035A8E47E